MKIFNWLHRLTCDHYYEHVFVNKREIGETMIAYDYVIAVCVKCGKTHKVVP